MGLSSRNLTGDTEPWAYLNNHDIRYAERPDTLSDKYDWSPRPERGFVPTNRPNPILLAFRESGSTPFEWWRWLMLPNDKTTPPWLVHPDEEHEVVHAIKVLGLACRLKIAHV